MSARTVILLLVAAGGLLAGLLLPSLNKAGERAASARCVSNLREIHAAWRKHGNLARNGLKPELLVCPEWRGEAVERADDGRFVLDENSSSYDVLPRDLAPSAAPGAILAHDREPCHSGGRHVIRADGSVQWLGEAEFQKLLEADRRRFGDGPRAMEGKRP